MTWGIHPNQKSIFVPRQQNLGGTRSHMGLQCYNCGSSSQLIRQYPYSLKVKHSETPGKNNSNIGKVSAEEENNVGKGDSNTILNITPCEESNHDLNSKPKEDISSELNKVTVTMHGISSKTVTGGVQLGPILTTMVRWRE